MKKLISIVAFIVAGFFLNELRAQGAEDDIQIIQGAWGKQKRELVRIAMELSAKDSVKFWPVYDRYEVARKKIGRDRLMILNEYVASYETLTNAKADTLVNRLFKNDAANAQLLQQYYVSNEKSAQCFAGGQVPSCRKLPAILYQNTSAGKPALYW